MMNNHRSLMMDLQKIHDVIVRLLENRRFHYIDIPIHDNIGDLLIMKGTLRFFAKHKLVPASVSSVVSFNADWVKPGDVLVFHGGGNFGDLYANINDLREALIARFPQNRVVIMPQTIFFSTEEKQQRAAAVFRRHPDLHLFVRDRVSLAIAREFTGHAYLAPDMAHHLYPIAARSEAGAGTLRIARVDQEKPAAAAAAGALAYDKRTDWIDLIGGESRLIDLVWKLEYQFQHRKWDRLRRKLGPMVWVPISNRFSAKAISLFSRYDHIVTDRLHGHILACLMDKKNTVIDNSYGKNSTYINEWTRASDMVHLVGAPA